MRFLVMADATAATGMGHVSRCLHVAHAVRRVSPDTDVRFVGQIEGQMATRICDEGFVVADGDAPQPGDMILHDKYGVSQDRVDRLFQTDARVVMLDDFGLLDLSRADMVVNFRVGAQEMYRYGSGRDLLGVDYFPVPSGLHVVRKARAVAEVPVRMLMFVGGGASPTAEMQLVRAAKTAAPNAQLRLLSGHDHGADDLGALEIGRPLGSIAPHLAWADALICGGGLVKYEAGYCGLPVACLSQTKGQHDDTLFLAGRDLTFDLGLAQDTSPDQLTHRIAAFLDPSIQHRISQACLATFPQNSDRVLATALLEG